MPRKRWKAVAKPLLLGLGLSLLAVWPASVIPIGGARLIWQPLFILALVVMLWRRHKKLAGSLSWAQAVVYWLVFSFSGWLSFLHTTSYWTEYPYPRSYGIYLFFYEATIAGGIAFCAVRALRAFGQNPDDWRAPLIAAPFLLAARAISVHHPWAVLTGVAVGGLLGRAGLKPVSLKSKRSQQALSAAVFVVGLLIVWGAALRVYSQTGANFPIASDDGKSYNFMAIDMAKNPAAFFGTSLKRDQFHFTGYFPLMALWIMLVGYHIPSWLFWHGVAGGLFAYSILKFGRQLGGWGMGASAAGLVVCDRILLYLMSTMNMETFFLPTLYTSLAIWAAGWQADRSQCAKVSFWAGFVLGLATWFRATSVLLPIALGLVLFFERPRPSPGLFWKQTAWLFAGFSIPVALLLLHHRFAWGYWTLTGLNGKYASGANYALVIEGKTPSHVGLGPWLALLFQHPQVIWQQMVPAWGEQLLSLWTHPGFGQMDLIMGLNHEGPYQAVVASLFAVGIIIGAGFALWRRSRADMICLILPLYFSALILAFWVINARYRSPFMPALIALFALGCREVLKKASTRES